MGGITEYRTYFYNTTRCRRKLVYTGGVGA
nr:MAG TPA: hypothetical protein [Caudoviricetes sp.]